MSADTVDNLCWDIVTTIADERGIDQRDVDEQLYDVIDPDALGRLARQSGETDDISLSVSFRMAECYVTVTDGGKVRANHPSTPE
ncbi:HalOD1 output domain-containing protein [Halorubrum sp. CSM-61]|uniref:HalOD1 output domain-containing protein n=1 Tax=Halorubrum sp. CSM-61 TaxID=2485838 RepID=UPI000F4B340F|nr:HalOD1 output domain-containing protein [Halorubrum sp. CSM-61]